jgi:hypothetical protein
MAGHYSPASIVVLLPRIVYGSTKGFVSYGGFTHVGFPYARRFPLPHFIRLVSNYHSPLSLPLPSRRSRVPTSAVVLFTHRVEVHRT